jgi:hypothetical protein
MGPVEDPVYSEERGSATCRAVGERERSNLSRDATSMMRGISREKPALVLFRYMEMIWSL